MNEPIKKSPETMHSETADKSLVGRREFAKHLLGGMSAVLLFDSLGCGDDSSSSGSQITKNDLVGTWTVSFQWSGRSPGVLTLVINSDFTYSTPAGPGVGASSGTLSITINGNNITMVESGPSSEGTTWIGTATSSTRFAGTWQGANGNTGTFSACKGSQACSTTPGGGSGGSPS